MPERRHLTDRQRFNQAFRVALEVLQIERDSEPRDLTAEEKKLLVEEHLRTVRCNCAADVVQAYDHLQAAAHGALESGNDQVYDAIQTALAFLRPARELSRKAAGW